MIELRHDEKMVIVLKEDLDGFRLISKPDFVNDDDHLVSTLVEEVSSLVAQICDKIEEVKINYNRRNFIRRVK